MRSLLAALLLLTPALTGCLDGSLIDQLRNDLEAEDEFVDRSLLQETVEFSPAGIVDPSNTYEDESDVSHQWNTTVLVPEGTRSVTVQFQISFSTVDDGGTLPDVGPNGEVQVYIQTSGGEQRNLTRTEPATAGFDFTSPDDGEWTVGMKARGNGTVTFNVDAIVPAGAPTG